MSRWNPVQSSNLGRVRYFRRTSLLAVEFKDGRIYIYGGVPWSIYMRLLRAESHGKYFARHIRKKYQFQKVTDKQWYEQLKGKTA